MPTPSDETTTTIPSTTPLEVVSSRASFASCPPEEDRPIHAPRETRSHSAQSDNIDPGLIAEDHTIRQQEGTPDPDTMPGASERNSVREETEKAEHVEDAHGVGVATLVGDSPSPVGSSEAGSDSDVRLAQSMATAALSVSDENEASAQYLCYPPLNRNRLSPHSTSSFLRPGSKFKGTQQSDRQVYDVQVEIKDVDLTESFLCGYLRIQGLTDDHPTLTTFFEGEIIGPKHLFRTTHPSWNSSEKIDLQHWARFPPFRPLAKTAKSNSSFTLKNNLDREHLFMRWKEYFLVPDHRVKSISGASFEGFYYICFDQRVGGVSGIYFHAKSEKYQQLELRHVDDGGCVGAVEFR